MIALAGPAANLGTAAVIGGAALTDLSGISIDVGLWLLAAGNLLAGVANLVPSGTPGTSDPPSDGRVAQLVWALDHGHAIPAHEPGPPASDEAPEPPSASFRWPFVAALLAVAVLAVAVGQAALLMPLAVLFGGALLLGAHRCVVFIPPVLRERAFRSWR
jgi:hypothetical protein